MNVFFETVEGSRFMARPEAVGTSHEELELINGMPPTAAREARIASLRQNIRHAYETLLTTETLGRG